LARRNAQEELHTKNVQSLNNDYIRSNPQAKALYKARQAVLRRRRMAIFFILAAIVIVVLVQANRVQNERLAAKVEQKQAVTEQLEQILEKEELLKLQIAKLEDDEYIAKLARKEFFLSEEGEIIFTMPNSSEKDDEKEAEDEQ
jgi:cell division protein DivIC